MHAPPAIDPEVICSLRNLDDGADDFLRQIVGLFLEDVPTRLRDLEAAMAAADAAKAVLAAHSIKGSAANLGAIDLRAAAARLEEAIRASGLSGVDPALSEVRVEFARAKKELEAIVTARRSSPAADPKPAAPPAP